MLIFPPAHPANFRTGSQRCELELTENLDLADPKGKHFQTQGPLLSGEITEKKKIRLIQETFKKTGRK